MPDVFDADTLHPWAARRIPRITSPYPDWRYEVAVCVPDPASTYDLWQAVEPGDEYVDILASYVDYRRSYYRESYAAMMLERPFDVDGTTNTVILMLTAHGWKYRRSSFQHGPWPFWNNTTSQAQFPPTPTGLVALLDHIAHKSGSWTEWKTVHASIFTTPTTQTGDTQ